MKYRKKPVVVEAWRWEGQTGDQWPNWVHKASVRYPVKTKLFLEIPTLEGLMLASLGDYIIKGVKGEVYPCKPDIFEETYETAEGSDE
jgi:hypothetical protein